MVRFGLGLVALGCSLACAGAAPSQAGGDTRGLLAFRMAGAQCEWLRWSEATGAQTVGKSAQCPDQVVFKPDGSKVIYSKDKVAHVALWPGVREPVDIPYPAHGQADWEPLWVGSDGVLRLDGFVFAEKTEKGDEVVLSSGELRESVWKLPSGALTRTPLTEPNPEDGTLYALGVPVIRVSYEANRKGAGWTVLSSEPYSLELTAYPPPEEHPGAWPSLGSTYRACNTGQECERDDWKERPDLKVLFPEERTIPGFLPAGAGGWLFGVQWGDTPHAQAPVLWCAEPTCKAPQALTDLPPDGHQLSLQPQGELMLAGEEFSMKEARVYRMGKAEPIFSVQGGLGAGWLPEGVR